MWIMMNDAFLSIVDKASVKEKLSVRARFKGDIEKVFPDAKVTRTPKGDYLFRAEIDRVEVGAAIAKRITDISYDNFKNSVEEEWRHDAYLDIWCTMWNEQFNQEFPNGKKSWINEYYSVKNGLKTYDSYIAGKKKVKVG